MRISEYGQSARRLSPLAIAFLAVALLLGAGGGAVAGAMITGSQIKDGTVASADIKNDSLSRADMIDEPRTWGAAVVEVDNFTSNSFTPVVTRSATTTAAGFLTINATLFAQDDFGLTGLGSLVYSLRIDGKLLSGYRVLDFVGEQGLTGAITVVVPAAKGAHSVSLVARDDADGSYIQAAELSVTYSPTGASSGVLYEVPLRPSVSRNVR